MKKRTSLKMKFLLYVGSVVILAFVSTIIFVGIKANNAAYNLTINSAEESGYRYSNYTRDLMTKPLDTARVIARMFSGLKQSGGEISRESALEMLKTALKEEPELLGIGVVFEPDKFDGKDKEYVNAPGHNESGRFMPYWNRQGGIHLEAHSVAGAEKKGGYYKRPFDNNREVLMEPVTYTIGGKDIMVVSSCVPVRVDGKPIGVVGVDYSMNTFWELAKKTHPFKDGYISIISNNGSIVAHPKSELIGRSIKGFVEKGVLEKISSGKTFIEKRKSPETGIVSFNEFVPVEFGDEIPPWSLALIVPEKTIFKDSASLRNIAIIIGLVSIFVVCSLLYGIGQKIVSEPVEKVMKGVKEIAEGEGDLTKRLDIKNTDEIGELAYWFNKFLDNLQIIMKTISNNVSEMDGSSQDLLSIASDVRRETEKTSSKADLVAAASEKLSSNMNSVAGSTEQTSVNISGVASAMEEMTSTVNEIARNAETTQKVTEKAVAKSEETSRKMDELGAAAKEIGNVVETISDISDQTNLLALNATIEAARAGDAGRGFAVVANEIKELANQTASATNDIKGKIEWIQSATGTSVLEMADIKKIISEISDFITTIATAVEEQSVSSDEISNNVNQAALGVNEVNGNVGQASTVSGEIARDISIVNSAVSLIDESGKKVYSSARRLSSGSDELRKIIKGFKI